MRLITSSGDFSGFEKSFATFVLRLCIGDGRRLELPPMC
jgi:hypothetical protein